MTDNVCVHAHTLSFFMHKKPFCINRIRVKKTTKPPNSNRLNVVTKIYVNKMKMKELDFDNS